MMRTRRAARIPAGTRTFTSLMLVCLASLIGIGVTLHQAATPAVSQTANDAIISKAELELVRAVEKARIIAVEKVYHTVVAIYGMTTVAAGVASQDEVPQLIPMFLYPFRANENYGVILVNGKPAKVDVD